MGEMKKALLMAMDMMMPMYGMMCNPMLYSALMQNGC